MCSLVHVWSVSGKSQAVTVWEGELSRKEINEGESYH